MNVIMEQINSAGNAFVDFAVPMLIQSGVLIIILLFLDLFLKKRIRAVFRYWIWMIVLLKLVLPTTLSSPTSPAYWLIDEPQSTMLEEPFAAEEHPGMSPSSETLIAPPTLAGPESPAVSFAPRSSVTWQGYVFLAWLAAVLVMVALLIQRAFFVKRLIAESAEASEELLLILERAREKMGIRRPIALRLSSIAVSPSVCGLLRPTILIPKALPDEIDPRHLESILMHELAHIKRADLWVNSIQAIVQIIYIYNPLLWVANAIIRKVREQAVDEMVLVAMGEQAEDYPKTLLNISRLAFGSPALSLRLIGVVESKKALIGRIKHITSRPFPKNAKLGIGGLLAVIILSAALLPMARAEKSAQGNAPIIAEGKEESTKSLHQAAADGDLEQVKLHILNSADVNAKDQRGRAALHRAANAGHIEVVRLLIEHGADVNVEDKLKRTPLEHAAVAGRTEVAKLLIERGANPDARNQDGSTSLHVAAGSTDKDTVRLLIDEGADVTLKDAVGQTPLHAAMMSANASRREIVDIIVATGKVPSTIHLAAYMGDLAKVKTFIEEGVAVNENDPGAATALHCAAAGGQKEVAQLLLSRGADVNVQAADGMTPLHSAVFYSDNAETVKLLIANGANVNSSVSVEDDSGMSVLGLRLLRCVMQSLSKNDDEMTAKTKSLWNSDVTNVLTSNGARFGDGDKMCLSIAEKMDIPYITKLAPTKNDDENEKQPDHSATLRQAAAEGDVEQVKKLLATGAAINAKDSDGNTPLNLAVKAGHRAIVMLLIDKGADVNAPGRWSARPLHEAAWEGHVELVKLLIARGADVNAWQGDYWTPLHSAAEQGHKDVAEILIASGADINLNREGGTPLHTAAGQGQLEMAALLIDKGADIGARDSTGRTPLHVACQAGHDDIVKLLLARGADIEAKEGKEGRTPLHLAALRARKDVAETLLEAGADINSRNDRWNSTPLHDATIPGDMGLITLLVAEGADLNAMDGPGKTALHNAVEFNRPEVVKFFLAKGADINQKRQGGNAAPLHIATSQDNKDMIELLLANGADINVKVHGLSALHVAIIENKLNMVRFLLAKGFKTSTVNMAAFFGELDKVKTLIADGADINQGDTADFTPLHCAIYGNHKQAVTFLIENGADVDAQTAEGRFPLIIADIEIAELLITKGANVNLRHRLGGHTVLHVAVNLNDHKGDIELVKLFLSHGVDVNAKAHSNHVGWEGWTAFHVACRNGNKAIVEMLISKGADINAKTDKGHTPMSLAEKYGRYTPMSMAEEINGHKQIVEMLRKHGAKE